MLKITSYLHDLFFNGRLASTLVFSTWDWIDHPPTWGTVLLTRENRKMYWKITNATKYSLTGDVAHNYLILSALTITNLLTFLWPTARKQSTSFLFYSLFLRTSITRDKDFKLNFTDFWRGMADGKTKGGSHSWLSVRVKSLINTRWLFSSHVSTFLLHSPTPPDYRLCRM